MDSRLREVIQRVESWPEADQEEAADILLAIEAERRAQPPVSKEDLEALKRSAEDERLGRLVSLDDFEKMLRRFEQ